MALVQLGCGSARWGAQQVDNVVLCDQQKIQVRTVSNAKFFPPAMQALDVMGHAQTEGLHHLAVVQLPVTVQGENKYTQTRYMLSK